MCVFVGNESLSVKSFGARKERDGVLTRPSILEYVLRMYLAVGGFA